MSGGFSNPIIGGGGALVYPSIHSPDYVTEVSGWSINKAGDAEFNDVTIRGTIDGVDYIINSSGYFLYTGTPANGNLFFSVAPQAGTDQFGNTYPQGMAAGQFSGRHVTINNTGTIDLWNNSGNDVARWTSNDGSLKFYTPAAATGNLIMSISPASGTDQYGNAYPSGISLAPGGQLTAGDSVIDPDGLFVYSGTPANGNLSISIAPASGTDGFSNTYPAGIGISAGGQLVAGNTIVNRHGVFTYSTTPAAGKLTGSTASSSGTDVYGNHYLAGTVAYDDSNGTASELGGDSLVFYTGSLSGGWTQETWHVLAPNFNAGWTGTIRLQHVPIGGGLVSISANLDPSAATVADGTVIWTLGGTYAPSHYKRVAMGCDALKVNGSTFQGASLYIGSNGDLQCYGVGTAATYFEGCGMYALQDP